MLRGCYLTINTEKSQNIGISIQYFFQNKLELLKDLIISGFEIKSVYEIISASNFFSSTYSLQGSFVDSWLPTPESLKNVPKNFSLLTLFSAIGVVGEERLVVVDSMEKSEIHRS